MGFDFTGIKTNLEGINKYLESNGIKLSDDESQQLVSIFNKVDTSTYKEGEQGYNDGKLDFAEENEFKKQIASLLPKIADKTNAFFSGIRNKFLNGVTNEYTEAQTDATRVDNSNTVTLAEAYVSAKVINNRMNYSRSDILEIAVDQVIKRMPELKNIKPDSKRIDITKRKYPQAYNKALKKANTVTDMVIKNCKKYEVSDLTPVVTTMLGVETGGFVFSAKNLNKKGKPGCPKGSMQTDLDAINTLYNDNKSSDVKFVKELKSKYKTPGALYTAIQSDVELGLQVGILVFKAKIRGAGGNVAKGVKSYCGNQYKYDYSLKTPNTVTV